MHYFGGTFPLLWVALPRRFGQLMLYKTQVNKTLFLLRSLFPMKIIKIFSFLSIKLFPREWVSLFFDSGGGMFLPTRKEMKFFVAIETEAKNRKSTRNFLTQIILRRGKRECENDLPFEKRGGSFFITQS